MPVASTTTSTIVTTRFRALGSSIEIAVTDPRALAEVERIVRDRFDEIDRTFSRFRSDSELADLERGAGRPQHASRLFAELLDLACRAAASTGGWFDPTVRDALEAAGYDRSIEQIEASGPGPALPTRPAGRWREIRYHLDGCVVLLPEGARLDFGGIGKGFAVDYALRALAGIGCGVLVNAGGDIGIAGPAPEGGWLCEVAPDTDGPPETTVRLERGALATSGLGRRQWSRGGERLHHLIDPRTGRPAASPWTIVSVAARDCAVAEVAAKVGWLRGEDGPDWIGSLDLASRFSGCGRVVTVGGWPAGGNEAAT